MCKFVNGKLSSSFSLTDTKKVTNHVRLYVESFSGISDKISGKIQTFTLNRLGPSATHKSRKPDL